MLLSLVQWLVKTVCVCVCVCVSVGPFWICVTLVFSVAISGNLSVFLSQMGNPSFHYRPQFHRGQCFDKQLGLSQFYFTHTFCYVVLVFNSDNSCSCHLLVCLAGAHWFMGIPDLAARGWEADWRLFLPGDCLCLRLLPLHLYPHLGESICLPWGLFMDVS